MKFEAVLNYYIYNGEIVKTEDESKFQRIKNSIVYEVIRIIDGKPLFFEEHMKRMRDSAQLLKGRLEKSDDEIKREIYKLIELNKESNINVKLVCGNIHGSNEFISYFIKSTYPKKEVYDKGIHTITYKEERDNPNAKVINNSMRQAVGEELKKENAFEALLVNENNCVTEGSRSNIFFVKENCVYTAANKKVLMGITREKIMEICKKLNITIKEEELCKNDLNNIEGAFMTGTSVNVLPISSIDFIKLNSVDNELIKIIGRSYKKMMMNYIKVEKNNHI